jgi:hypothetical protein
MELYSEWMIVEYPQALVNFLMAITVEKERRHIRKTYSMITNAIDRFFLT